MHYRKYVIELQRFSFFMGEVSYNVVTARCTNTVICVGER